MLTIPARADRTQIASPRRKSTLARAKVALRRRLWDLQEVTEILNRGLMDGRRPRYSVETVRGWVAVGQLPAIVLPSAWASDRRKPLWRTYRVPDVWLPYWFAMGNRDQAHPIFTEREAIGDDDDPPWVTINDAGLAVGVSHETMGEFVRLGLIEAHTEPSGTSVISVRTLDNWVHRMVHIAEEEWYSGMEAVNA